VGNRDDKGLAHPGDMATRRTLGKAPATTVRRFSGCAWF
jgi:hypothetical protein